MSLLASREPLLRSEPRLQRLLDWDPADHDEQGAEILEQVRKMRILAQDDIKMLASNIFF